MVESWNNDNNRRFINIFETQVKFLQTERFFQDHLEDYFGRQRSMGPRRDNSNLRPYKR